MLYPLSYERRLWRGHCTGRSSDPDPVVSATERTRNERTEPPMTTARDVMTKNVEIIELSATVDQVAKTMAKKDIGAMPVGDNGRLKGMITDRDITAMAVAKD